MARSSLKSILKSLLEEVKASPVPIRSIELDQTAKRVKVEFVGDGLPVAPIQQADAGWRGWLGADAGAVKYVPGTTIPDDLSPINPLDAVLQNPDYALDPEAGPAPEAGN